MEPVASALVILNGEPPSRSLLYRKWGKYSLKICADGAADFLYKVEVNPDFVIGDLDSISLELKNKLPEKNLIYVPNQNMTDGEKIIYFCIEKKINEIEFLGALGRRLDHALYNIELLKLCLEKSIQAKFLTDHDEIFLINRSISINGEIGERISFFSVFGETIGVKTDGLKYPISDQTMRFGFFSSPSNEFSKQRATLTIEKGFLLIIRERNID